jgi:hypothetical protein
LILKDKYSLFTDLARNIVLPGSPSNPDEPSSPGKPLKENNFLLKIINQS